MMADPNTPSGSADDPKNPAGQAAGQPPSVPTDILKEAKSQAYAQGRKEGLTELFGKLNVKSDEELVTRLQSLREREEQEQVRKLADQQEREALAQQLTTAQSSITELEKRSGQLDQLREDLRLSQLRNAAEAAGCLKDAAGLVVMDVAGRVKWNKDFSKLEVYDDEGKPSEKTIEAMLTEHKEAKPFLYGRQRGTGSGLSSQTQGQRQGSAPYSPQSTLNERLNWGR